jgi:hypothetical protein
VSLESDVIKGLAHILGGVRLLLFGESPPPEYRLVLSFVVFNPVKFYPEGVYMLTLKSDQISVAHVKAVDAEGHPTTDFEDDPVWETANPQIVTVQPSADGLTCVVGSPTPGQLGVSTVSVKATVGGKEIVGQADVEVVAAEAVSMEITFDAPK